MQFSPSKILEPFVKNYSVITIEHDLVDEVFYPSGHIDLVVNISGGSAATIIGGCKKDTPEVELLGHLTVPTRLDVSKRTSVLIARMFPHASRAFFRDSSAAFTNHATDLCDVMPVETRELHEQLMECASLEGKVQRLDGYLVEKLRRSESGCRRALLAADICRVISGSDERLLGSSLSERYGFSDRHIQNLFREQVGLSPMGFFAVTRFNRALDMLRSPGPSLTSIALDCGYYDQAHFIKDFKKFTGVKPSRARVSLTKNGEEFQQAVNIGF